MANYDRQRAERDFNLNPPSNAPGQGGDGWDDIFKDSSLDAGVNNFSGVDTDVSSILNSTSVSNSTPINVQNTGMNQQAFGSMMSSKLDEAAIKGAEGLWAYLKVVITSLRNNSSKDWNKLGTRACKLSVVTFGLSMVFMLLSHTVVPSLNNGFDLAIGSCMSLMTGVILVGCNRKNDFTSSNEVSDIQKTNDLVPDSSASGTFSDEELASIFADDDDDVDESSYYDGDDYDIYGDDFSDLSSSNYNSSPIVSVDEAISSIQDVPSGQYTRQYLFETFIKVLPSIKSSFMDMEDVYDASDEFMMFEEYLRMSARQTGLDDDKLDELQLLEVRKNLFIIQLIATRPAKMKEEAIAEGVADCYSRDDYGSVIQGREGVFARVNSQVGKLIIDIFLCNNVMVSLGDIYRKKSNFILDINNTMPLIWGINEMGNVFCYDGMRDGNGGIIISGEARSGKSWKGQSLIAQMCMFMSPKELEFYFYDVKGEASDYAYLSKVLPHCKGFCGEALKFNDSISTLLERESKRRTALLANKYTNVKDYNKDHPNEKIPTTYIVIDEMATAMSEMKDYDIDTRKKFDSLLIQIATKYPYLELKLLLFPHRIVNDIINKTVSSMISTRSVMGNVPAEELKSALDVKNFPYSLVKTGDMAIKTKSLNNGNAVYSHSEVLTASEQENRKIFDYIGAVWGKLEPECKPMGGSLFSTTAKKSVSIVKDTSSYKEDFKYSPLNHSSNASDITDLFEDRKDVDESFWNDIFEETSSSESDEDFWKGF